MSETVNVILHFCIQVASAVVMLHLASACKKKKASSSFKDSAMKSEKDQPKPHAPEDKKAVAGTYDPNYQTLAGVKGDCFEQKDGAGAAPAGAPKAPAQGGMAATQDPNYQTLAGVGGNEQVFGGDKAAGGGAGAAPPKPPSQGGMAATQDPNYQTLAGVGGNDKVFGADKKK